MRQGIILLLIFISVLPAQNKKVIANLPPQWQRARGNCSEREDCGCTRRRARESEIADADGIVGVSLTPELLKQAKQLKWLHISSAGVEPHAEIRSACSRSSLTATWLSPMQRTSTAAQIADHAFAFLLALTRKLNVTIPQQKLEEWPTGRGGMFELDGKTAVIIGVGGIGSQIAQRAHGFGMKVIGVDLRDIPTSTILQRLVKPDMLDAVLPEADVVFVAVPHTKKSEGMLGARQFELMKQGSYFIAMSRGKIYDHGALAKALDSKRLAGAGLDATEPEPLPKGPLSLEIPKRSHHSPHLRRLRQPAGTLGLLGQRKHSALRRRS
ncbi:MAG: NAD(P)-dependent oxidoreductase [Bryobacteraceae bacterium]